MKIMDIILWILIIVALIISLWYLFDHTPSFEEAILILILTILYTINTRISDIGARLYQSERRFSNLEKSFIKLVNDFKEGKRR